MRTIALYEDNELWAKAFLLSQLDQSGVVAAAIPVRALKLRNCRLVTILPSLLSNGIAIGIQRQEYRALAGK